MRALTIWQPWASLIIIGAKPFEWRRWQAPAFAIDQDIVIHAGVRRVVCDEIDELLFDLTIGDNPNGLDPAKAIALLTPILDGSAVLPTGVALGTAHLGAARLATEIASEVGHGQFDSDRTDDAIWGWPLTNIQRWAEPVPARGAQGFWTWPDAATAAGDF